MSSRTCPASFPAGRSSPVVCVSFFKSFDLAHSAADRSSASSFGSFSRAAFFQFIMASFWVLPVTLMSWRFSSQIFLRPSIVGLRCPLFSTHSMISESLWPVMPRHSRSMSRADISSYCAVRFISVSLACLRWHELWRPFQERGIAHRFLWPAFWLRSLRQKTMSNVFVVRFWSLVLLVFGRPSKTGQIGEGWTSRNPKAYFSAYGCPL